MAVVTFHQTDRSIDVPQGTTVLQAARQAGLVIESPCNGAGTCGKCTVQLASDSVGNVVQRGMHRLSPDLISRGFVLSCEAEIAGDIAVVTLPREQHLSLRVLSQGVGCAVQLDPFIGKSFDDSSNTTRVYGGCRELALEAGDTRHRTYGVVVDIGTTTLSASLVHIPTGSEIACAGSLNPQSHHAQDVLSRIRFAATEEGLQTMHAVLIEEIGRLIGSLAREAAIMPQSVYEIVFSGNTCMLHLALRENPAPLGKFPYLSNLRGDESRPASGLKLPVAPNALVYLPPVISAFVGPDITSGILATGLGSDPGITLLVDIGTNGEMVIGMNGRLFATSTAAGPAFEGMNISCGMRASDGAIEALSIDARGELAVTTIGDVEATGICGSGLIDAVAQLVACGVISANGRFASPESPGFPAGLKSRLERRDGKVVFRITDRVSLSQKDVRQLQLAKGAVRAGIEFLLERAGVVAGRVGRVLIAGSFGYHLRPESLLTIGLLPPELAGKTALVGNTSKTGGEAFLLNRAARREMAALVTGIEVVDLASYPDFDRRYVECLGFPARREPAAEGACISQ